MAYQIYKFDDVLLPLDNSEQTHSPGDTESSLVLSVGGVYDYFGTRTRLPLIIPVDISGWFVGKKANEVDDGGTFIVDDSGNRIVTHAASVDLRVQVASLQRKIGQRASLWRRWITDNTEQQWKTVRLLRAPYPQDFEAGCVVAEMSAMFETRHYGWHDETLTTSTATMASNIKALTVRNGGSLRVDDAQIVIVGTGTSITSVKIEYPAAGIDLRYTGTIANGETLTIDNEAKTVQLDGVDAYSDFARGSAHTAQGWVPLEPGNNPFMVTATGQGTVSITHYNQEP